jgi:hypothetical protein
VAKQQPQRGFTLLYDKVCRQDILQWAWQRVKSNKGSAGVDKVDMDAIRDYGEEQFLGELQQELRNHRYRAALVRRVHIPKPGQPGKTRPLGIPTVKDRVVQMAVKIAIEPLFEADFLPCSFGFRPKKTSRMALSTIVQSISEGYSFVVDVDLKSYFDTISHELLIELVERRVGDVQVLRLIRAWLKAGIMERGSRYDVPTCYRGRAVPASGTTPTTRLLATTGGGCVLIFSIASEDLKPNWNLLMTAQTGYSRTLKIPANPVLNNSKCVALFSVTCKAEKLQTFLR